MPANVRRAIRGVFADIDDTITTHGTLQPEAYAALARLRAAGKLVIPITGRPAGWCDHIARMWPVDAVVGENGAFFMRYDAAARRLVRRFVVDDATRRAQRARLGTIGQAILAAVPGTALASDQHYRECDLAIDFCEDVPALGDAAIDAIVREFEGAGATCKVSSIHVNGWFGQYDKLSMAHLLMRERYGLELSREREKCMFVGDSPNDAPMFAYLPHAAGVANVAAFAGRMLHLPTYVAPSRGGAGFAEVAQALLTARQH